MGLASGAVLRLLRGRGHSANFSQIAQQAGSAQHQLKEDIHDEIPLHVCLEAAAASAVNAAVW
jgi:hypothetical protein